ncbi:MAG: Crp/Fnr family transcriptional regulator [Burkholderiales bacterium]|nr:Crp/Fnr family transcriptional regulator [Burkholderiales bacterium]
MAEAENHLIAALARSDRKRLLALCEPVPLVPSEVLLRDAGAPTSSVLFPVRGFISLITQVDHGDGVEVGMVGREGMLGVQLVLGVTAAPVRAVVQGPGQAWRIGRAPFLRELARNPALQRLLDRYAYVLMRQWAIASACQRYHDLGSRLARWLLMCHDRAQADRFRVTHEGIAAMLGVRRVGVTVAAGALQARGIIRYHRGELSVLDRSALEAHACSCYGADRLAYREGMGEPGERKGREGPRRRPDRDHAALPAGSKRVYTPLMTA